MSDNGTYNSFSTTGRGSFGTREFLESNSLVAKFAFLLLIIFLFIILLRVCVSILAYFLKPKSSPHLMDGMIDARQMIVYPQEVWNIYSNGYSSWSSMFNAYQVQVSLIQNGTTQSSVTI